jgi:hypothetical protein
MSGMSLVKKRTYYNHVNSTSVKKSARSNHVIWPSGKYFFFVKLKSSWSSGAELRKRNEYIVILSFLNTLYIRNELIIIF